MFASSWPSSPSTSSTPLHEVHEVPLRCPSATASTWTDVSYARKRRRRYTPTATTDAQSQPSNPHSSYSPFPTTAPPSMPSHDPPHSSRHRRHVYSLLSPLALLPLLLLLLPLASASPPCVRFADYDSINQMFIDGGPGAKVLLCPNKLYRLSGSIVFTAADQELATYGYPTGSERAILRVEGKDTATAIQGDCRRCARVGIRSVVVDGNRKKLGRMADADLATGLVVLGGNEGQSVRNCWLKNPRGFTAVHIREGDKVSCTGAVVDRNEIGPVGEEYDPEVDGEDPEMSPVGRPLADGVSIACRDSFVRDNTFYDNTDAAIVIYCSPGTLVHANHIYARHLSAMAGILLVDSTPFDGDYTGVVVKSNVIDAASRSIRVGIGLGSRVWSDDTETVLIGGTVVANGLKGRYMGYGIAAAGLKGWTVKDNWDEARHEGRTSARCFDEPVNPDPTALLYYSPSIEDSIFQQGFVDQEFEYVVCIDGVYDKANPPKHDLPPLPHDLAEQPYHHSEGASDEAELEPEGGDSKSNANSNSKSSSSGNKAASGAGAGARAAAGKVVGFATGSEVMDDILEHSQQRMLEAIEHLNRRVDMLASDAGTGTHSGAVPLVGQDEGSAIEGKLDKAVATHLERLQRRVESLESAQTLLLESAVAMRSAIQAWDQEMATVTEWQYDVLLDVRHKLELSLSPHTPISLDPTSNLDSDTDSIEGRAKAMKHASPRADLLEVDDHSHPEILKESWRAISNRARLRNPTSGSGTGSGAGAGAGAGIWTWGLKGGLMGGIGWLVWWGWKRWRKARVHTKLL